MINNTIHLSGEDAIDKVRELLKNFRSAMMVTRDEADDLHARPMGLQGEASDFDGTLWFFTDSGSRKTEEIAKDANASLVFQCDKDSAYLHLMGKAATVKDRAKMQELFTPIIRTWFPKGLEDPTLTLIRFDVKEGSFWDSPGGMLQVLGAFTKAVVTGKPGQGGEMGELKL